MPLPSGAHATSAGDPVADTTQRLGNLSTRQESYIPLGLAIAIAHAPVVPYFHDNIAPTTGGRFKLQIVLRGGVNRKLAWLPEARDRL